MLNLGIRDLNSRLTLIGGILLGTALGGLAVAGRHCVVLQPRKQGMHVNSHGYPMLCRHGRTGKSDKHQRPKSIRNATTTRQEPPPRRVTSFSYRMFLHVELGAQRQGGGQTDCGPYEKTRPRQ